VYRRMLEMFRAADAKYNSGLFHFRKRGDSFTFSGFRLRRGRK